MNNDFYAECLVTKAPTGADTAKRIGIGLAAAILAAAALWLIVFPMSILIIAGVFYSAYYLMTGIDAEYEYILTNGDISAHLMKPPISTAPPFLHQAAAARIITLISFTRASVMSVLSSLPMKKFLTVWSFSSPVS